MEQDNTNERLFCTFHLDKSLFGIEVHKIQEVIDYQKITQVPLSSSAIEGLMNLRGQIVTAIDLRELLELPARQAEQLPMNMVLQEGFGGVSLLVDEIGDIVSVQDSEFEPPPESLADNLKRIIFGAYKLEAHQLLLVLDTDKVANLNISDE